VSVGAHWIGKNQAKCITMLITKGASSYEH
jgi:hypothetical protein